MVVGRSRSSRLALQAGLEQRGDKTKETKPLISNYISYVNNNILRNFGFQTSPTCAMTMATAVEIGVCGNGL